MLEHEEGDESGGEEHEERDVGVDGHPVVEESSGVFEENALESEFGGVEEEHAEDDDGQDEGEDGHSNFPSVMRVVVTIMIRSVRGTAN